MQRIADIGPSAGRSRSGVRQGLDRSRDRQQPQQALDRPVFEGRDHALRVPVPSREFEHDVKHAELVCNPLRESRHAATVRF